MPKNKIDASELEYLKWYRQNIDFGPAHGDVILCLDEQFEEESGKRVPKNWRDEED